MDRREIIRSYFTPEMLREHPKYQVLVDSVSEEFGRTSDTVELMPILGQSDLMPSRYLPLLCRMLGIEPDYNQTAEAHREIIKRVFEARKNRGCSSSVVKSLSRGVDSEFFIEDLTYYNRKLVEQSAVIYPAHERIFRYSVSKASDTHRIEDGSLWDMGVLIVEVEDWSSRVQEKLYQVLPAGRIVRCFLYVTLAGQVVEIKPYDSWDPETGLVVPSTVWADVGVQGSVLRPTGLIGTDMALEFFMEEKPQAVGGMIYSVRGLLSGFKIGEEEVPLYTCSGSLLAVLEKNFGIEIFPEPLLSPYNGFADAEGSVLYPDTVLLYDGFYFSDLATLEAWSGAYLDELDGGSFGS